MRFRFRSLPETASAPADLNDWPPQLQYLVQQNSPERVWRIGLEELGYPPTWIHQASEAARVAGRL